MTDRWYILKDRKPVPVTTLEEWAHWRSTADNHVAQDSFGDVNVSTVFLGLDHRHFGVGAPLVFETMIFGGEHDQEQWRCSTWEEAEKQHAEAVRIARPLH